MKNSVGTLLIWTVWLAAMANVRPTLTCEYSKFSPSHTMCLPKGPGCPLLKNGVTGGEASFILDTHNKLRQKVANGHETQGGGQPKASDMRQMEWDGELASAAQKWAEQCKTQHDCSDCRRVPRFRVGQNVYMFGSTEDNSTSDWPATLHEWYREVSIFRTDQIHPFRYTSATAHYSQFTWADTHKIGCGWAYFKRGIWFTKLYVCDYGPGGNILGDAMYEKGEPCSACPDTATCSRTYPGLCGESGAAPVLASPRPTAWSPPWWLRTTTQRATKKLLFFCDFDSKDCNVETVGSGRWTVQSANPSAKDSYYEVKVRPGEDAHLYLYKADNGAIGADSAQACLSFGYRKYPQSSSTRPQSEAAPLETVLWKRGQHESFAERKFDGSARTWSNLRQTVPLQRDIYSISFHLTADSSLGSPQYLSLDNVRLDEGPCA